MVPLAVARRAERASCSSAAPHVARSAGGQQKLSARVAMGAAGLQQSAAGRVVACRAQRLQVVGGALEAGVGLLGNKASTPFPFADCPEWAARLKTHQRLRAHPAAVANLE